ncbi:MAG TPA: RNA polymerase sigma-70 factor [Puia sp.]|nr:RNA polymerase sigma-70 factor [Puia sp.]
MTDISIYEKMTDETLLSLLMQDDADAFAMLYRRHWEPMFLNAARVLSSREDGRDVVQEVFISLWDRRRTLNVTGSVLAYLQTSIKYMAIRFIRKNITRRDYLSRLTRAETEASAADGEERVQLKEIQHVITHAVEHMPTKMREVYLLSREEQLSHNEIAEQLGISPETVKKHIQHALQLIRTAIANSPVSLTTILTFLFFKK